MTFLGVAAPGVTFMGVAAPGVTFLALTSPPHQHSRDNLLGSPNSRSLRVTLLAPWGPRRWHRDPPVPPVARAGCDPRTQRQHLLAVSPQGPHQVLTGARRCCSCRGCSAAGSHICSHSPRCHQHGQMCSCCLGSMTLGPRTVPMDRNV